MWNLYMLTFKLAVKQTYKLGENDCSKKYNDLIIWVMYIILTYTAYWMCLNVWHILHTECAWMFDIYSILNVLERLTYTPYWMCLKVWHILHTECKKLEVFKHFFFPFYSVGVLGSCFQTDYQTNNFLNYQV